MHVGKTSFMLAGGTALDFHQQIVRLLSKFQGFAVHVR